MRVIEASNILNVLDQKNSHDFSDCEIKGELTIVLNANKSFNFSGSKFNGSVQIKISNHAQLNFNNAQFLENVRLIVHRGSLSCVDTQFNKGIIIESKEGIYLDFSKAKMAGVINICNSKINVATFSNAKFISESAGDKFIFEKNVIAEKSLFINTGFANAKFNGTEFQGLADFTDSIFSYILEPGDGNFFHCIFKGDAYFNNVGFDKGAFFNGTIFHGAALFVRLNKKGKCVGDYSGVIFHKRSFFDFSKFDNVSFNNCEFLDLASFKNFEANKLEISKAFFVKGADFLQSKIKDADRETFRIIKNEFLKINNQVEALHYRSKEMTAYEKEISFKNLPGEYLLLLLNKVSNNYGLSWLKGLKFTLICGIVFYCFYLISLGNLPFNWGWVSFDSFCRATGDTIKYFVRFFILTHDLDFMNSFRPTALSFIIDFLSKIFIGYGIYQTIQAFRKYGKG